MSKDKKSTPHLVTFIEDPYQISTLEISDAQNDSDELDLDPETQEGIELPSELLSESLPESLPESLEDQLDRLVQAISHPTEELPENTEEELKNNRLEAQIAEDQALAAEQAEEIAESLIEPSAETSEVELKLDAQEIQSCIESLLFISDKPLSLEKLHALLGPQFPLELFDQAMKALVQRYQAVHHGIELLEIAGGYQFRTKPGRAALAQKLAKVQTQRLSSGGMETLAIVAYKQPVMKEEIDQIRGVDSSYFVRGLMEKKLIKISGRSELPGRPILYTTSDEFLEIFGLKNLSALPPLRELEQMIPGSQTPHPDDDDPRTRDLRRMVGAMKADRSSILHYNPEEDEKILKEIKDRVTSIPSSTPYLDELKAAEVAEAAELRAVQAENLKNEPEIC